LAIITLTKVTPELDRTGQAGEISGVSQNAGPDSSAGAPDEVEVEVTPAMIEAGVVELRKFNDDFEMEENAVKRIFDAMFEEYLSYLAATGLSLRLDRSASA
jgi:hypothetical protein